MSIVDDEQHSMRPQHPYARRVTAARGHLLRYRSSPMRSIAFVAAPCIWPRGARNATAPAYSDRLLDG